MRLYPPLRRIKVTGWAKTVILRGKIIVNGDNFLAEKGFGEYIRRDIKTTGA